VRAPTIRRLLVFGVCALGVGGLYLVPSMARTPDQVGYPMAGDKPSARSSTTPTAASKGTAAGAASGQTSSQPPADEPTDAAADTEQTSRAEPVGQRRESRQTSPNSGATAFDPHDNPDNAPPDPVSGIDFGPVTEDTLTISWSAAHDDVTVIGYRIWLNGFEVATTAETHVTVNWFNDDMGQHVVQVRALDAAGNQSKTSPNVLVNRPTPTPTPTPSPTPTATPTGSTTPSAGPTQQASGKPTGSLPSTGVR
jgi:hypothetical protein